MGVPSDVEASKVARLYFEEARELVLANAYYADRLRSDDARKAVERAVAGIDGLPGAHEAIEMLVSLLEDRHSQFLRPEAERDLEYRSETQGQNPVGFRVATNVGYLRLPAILTLADDDEKAKDYVERAWSVLRADRDACAWIVDLRGNIGGTLTPMLAALAPLLDGGLAVGYTTRDGSTSSGEGVLIALLRKGAISLGGPTAGVPTGNVGVELSDGALLLLTTSLGTGRERELFDGPIAPMVPMFDGSVRHDGSLVTAAVDMVGDCRP